MKVTKEQLEFLWESNKIEREYGWEALADAINAWEFALRHKHHPIDINLTKRIHSQLMFRLNRTIAGHIRKCDVWVGGRKGAAPVAITNLLREWWDSYGNAKTEEAIQSAHVAWEKIHPFEDSNGRTGRIIMNIQRLNAGLPVLIIHEGKEQMEYYKWFK